MATPHADRPAAAADTPVDVSRVTTTGAGDTKVVEISHDEIRVRAYFLSLERGPHAGSELEIWLEAERQLREARSIPR